MSERTFVMLGVVAIPVGNQVECFVLTRDNGVFTKDIAPVPNEPLVRDLQTGIYYGRLWHLAPGTAPRMQTPHTADPAPGVGVAERFTGRVKACFVLSEGATQHQHTETTLVIETGPNLG